MKIAIIFGQPLGSSENFECPIGSKKLSFRIADVWVGIISMLLMCSCVGPGRGSPGPGSPGLGGMHDHVVIFYY